MLQFIWMNGFVCGRFCKRYAAKKNQGVTGGSCNTNMWAMKKGEKNDRNKFHIRKK